MSSTDILRSQMKVDDTSGSNRVSSIMNRDLLTMPVDSNIYEVAKKMSECRVNSIFLTSNDEEKKIIGIITQTDLTRKICATDQLSSKINAKSIMSSLITVDKNATIADAVQIMTRKGIKHLAVKSDADKIVGIISATDLAKYLKQKLSQYKYTNLKLGEELNIAEALSIPDLLLPYEGDNFDEEC
ncbi:MAG TPA: CBS domain-containing protein [Nitrososphaeraceae archaeon]|nr:CBS domain-containing protein [Nitrososphaeraceae archaeon]